MMKKLLIAFSTILMLHLMAAEASAQSTYNTGAGLRLGTGVGLTVKHFLSDKNAIEGILHTRWRGVMVTGLYEVHNDIGGAPGLRWFYGGGAHLGSWGTRANPGWGNEGTSYMVFGIDGIIGLDYKFSDAPINLSLDWKPAFNLTGWTGFWGDEVALSVRFTF